MDSSLCFWAYQGWPCIKPVVPPLISCFIGTISWLVWWEYCFSWGQWRMNLPRSQRHWSILSSSRTLPYRCWRAPTSTARIYFTTHPSWKYQPASQLESRIIFSKQLDLGLTPPTFSQARAKAQVQAQVQSQQLKSAANCLICWDQWCILGILRACLLS